jgi:hypothetical protein
MKGNIMTKTSNIVRASKALRSTARKAKAPKPVVIAGDDTALKGLATSAYKAESGKALFLELASKALGSKPDAARIKAVRREVIIGVAASRIDTPEAMTPAKRIAFVTDLIDNWQRPTTVEDEGKAKFNSKKKGYRTAAQERTIRNAEQRASKYLAELDASNARTDKDDNAKRANKGGTPHHGKADGDKPEVGADKPMDGVGYAASVLNMSAMLQHFIGKQAKHCPLEFNSVAEMAVALHSAAIAADKAFHVRMSESASK